MKGRGSVNNLKKSDGYKKNAPIPKLVNQNPKMNSAKKRNELSTKLGSFRKVNCGAFVRLPEPKTDKAYQSSTSALSEQFNIYNACITKVQKVIPASRMLVKQCADGTRRVINGSGGIADCCFKGDLQQNTLKYQTAQMIGLGIRLREIIYPKS